MNDCHPLLLFRAIPRITNKQSALRYRQNTNKQPARGRVHSRPQPASANSALLPLPAGPAAWWARQEALSRCPSLQSSSSAMIRLITRQQLHPMHLQVQQGTTSPASSTLSHQRGSRPALMGR